jgi:hypothetical protein
MFVPGVGGVGAKGNCSFQPSIADSIFINTKVIQYFPVVHMQVFCSENAKWLISFFSFD